MAGIGSDGISTDVLTQEKLDNQRDVVKNERRQSYENIPYGRAFQMIFENLFPKGHPYSWLVIGSHEDLTAASVDDVKEFFKTYYAPNNCSLVIAGDFEIEEAKQLVEKYFGSFEPGPSLERPRLWVPRLDGEKRIQVADRVPQERLYVVWPAPAYFQPEIRNSIWLPVFSHKARTRHLTLVCRPCLRCCGLQSPWD